MIETFTLPETRFLSNFYNVPHKIHYGGKEFHCVENAYCASKCFNFDDIEQFVGISAKEAKALGKIIPMRADFDEVKLGFMEGFVREKFKSGTELAEKLLATGDQELVEGNYWGDVFWGVCRGKGENNLGKILMKIRQGLKNGD